jgi:type II secretory pathway component PulC
MQFTAKFISKQKLMLIGGGLLITGAALYAAQWKWHFWHSASETTQPAVLEENPVSDESLLADENAAPDEGNALRDVLAANLFGQEGVVKKATNGSEPAPKTQQPLELHGVLFFPHHPEQAVALIAQAGGMAKKYKTGEEITSLPGWKVLEILPNSVRIGQEEPGEILPLLAVSPAPFGNGMPNENPANQFNNQLQDNSAPEDNIPPEDNPAPDANPPVDESIPPQDVPPEAVQPQSNMAPQNNVPAPNAAPVQNPPDLGLKKEDDGIFIDSRKGAVALGLKQADKIIAISGYDYADLQNNPATLKKILAQPAIEAVVERNGTSVDFAVPKSLLKSWRATI